MKRDWLYLVAWCALAYTTAVLSCATIQALVPARG